MDPENIERFLSRVGAVSPVVNPASFHVRCRAWDFELCPPCRAAAFCCCVPLRCSVAQTEPHSFSLEQVMSLPFLTNLVAAAAHAGRIAWVFSTRGERNVWIADAPNFEARQVTRYLGDDGLPIAALKLTPDGPAAIASRLDPLFVPTQPYQSN